MRYRLFVNVLVIIIISDLFACAILSKTSEKKDDHDQVVSLSDLPEPVRATVAKLTSGGEIKQLEKEEVDGKVVYDVEARVQDKDVEYDIASDGTVLSAEESVPYNSLPQAVRNTAEKYFGTAEGLKSSKEVEDGNIYFEVEGKKGSKMRVLKITDLGKIVEEE